MSKQLALLDYISIFMEVFVLNSIGIDVSKNKSMVAVLRPLGEVLRVPFEVILLTNNTILIFYACK